MSWVSWCHYQDVLEGQCCKEQCLSWSSTTNKTISPFVPEVMPVYNGSDSEWFRAKTDKSTKHSISGLLPWLHLQYCSVRDSKKETCYGLVFPHSCLHFYFCSPTQLKYHQTHQWRKTNSSKVRRIYWHKIRPCTWLILLLFQICDDVSSRKQLETAFFITHFSTIILFTGNVFFGRTLLIFSSHSAFSCALLSVFNSAI